MNAPWHDFRGKRCQSLNHVFLIFKPQGMRRVRKRVTLMAVVVSIIFGISWGTIQFLYTLHLFSSYQMNHIMYAVSNLMVLFNSAINPFVYALLNHNFRRKVKAILRYPKAKVDVTSQIQTYHVVNTKKPSNIRDSPNNFRASET